MSGFAHLGLDTRAALQALGAETAAPGGPAIGAAAMIAAAETIASLVKNPTVDEIIPSLDDDRLVPAIAKVIK